MILVNMISFSQRIKGKAKTASCAAIAVVCQCLVLLMAAQTADARSARAPMSPKQTVANVSTAMYEETAVDMQVKYLGGYLVLERQWSNGRWTFNPNWTDLQFYRVSKHLGVASFRGPESVGDEARGAINAALNRGASGNMGNAVPGDLSGDASVSDIKAIRRNSFKYEPADTSGSVFTYPGGKTIIRTASGYRWQNREGSWIDYTSAGRPYQFGNRQGHVTQIIRDTSGRVSDVVDHHGNTLVTFTYDGLGRPLTVTDYSGRQVAYTWVGSLLTAVTDVRGFTTSYTYNTISHDIFDDLGWRVITSRTDQERRVTTIFHSDFAGGLECAAGNATGLAPSFSIDNEGNPEVDSGDLARYFDVCTGWMVGLPRVTYSASYDTVGMIETYKYFYDGQRNTYETVVEKAGMGSQSYSANLLGENTGYYINEQLQYEYGISADRRTKVHTDRNGYVSTQTLDEFENLTHLQYADGTSESWSYGAFSNVLSHTDERGVATTMEYDDNGNLIRLVEAEGTTVERVTHYTYDALGRMTSMRQEGDDNTPEAITQWTAHDDYGNPLVKIDPENVETRYTYDVLGNVLTYQDGRGHTWRWTYDAAGNMLTATDPLEHTTTYTYDRVGNLTSISDANDIVVATYTYNARNSVTSVTNAYGQAKRFIYNNQNQLVTIRDENNNDTVVSHDSFGRPITITDGVGNVVRMSYEDKETNGGLLHQPTQIEYPSHTDVYEYDRRYRVTSVNRVLQNEDDQLTEYRYDPAGNLTRVIDPALRHWARTYDELNRLSAVIDADEGVIAYTYDDRNNIRTVTNELNVVLRALTFNRRNEITQEVLPSGKTHVYTHDNNGNLASVTDGKEQVLVQTFDRANRQSLAEYFVDEDVQAPQKTVSFTYNAVNRLTGYDDGNYSAVYDYDNMYRLLNETVAYGAFDLSHSYTYSPTGKKASLTQPNNQTNTYYYDAADRLNQVAIANVGTVTINQFDWHSPKRMTFPGGSVQENTYDDLQRLSGIAVSDPGGNALLNHQYDFSVKGNIRTKTTEHGVYQYTYDNMDRLIDAVNPVSADERYTFDATGNMLTALTTEGSWQYNEDNALLQAGANTFAYDHNNSVTQRTVNGETHNYVYDLENRLAEVRDGSDTILAQYHYDPFGRRVAKFENGQTTYYHYGDEGLLAEYDGTGQLIQAYSYFPDRPWGTDPLYTQVNGETYYYLNDQLGTPQKLINSNGATVWSAYYSALGYADVDALSSINNPLRYPGQYYDDTTGLHYNYMRDYDPAIGRYLQSDPIGIAGGINTFAYAYGNTNRFADPVGEFVNIVAWLGLNYGRCIAGCLGGAAIGAAAGMVWDFILARECEAGFGMGTAVGAVAGAAGGCALGCLDPTNWVGAGKAKKPTKESGQMCFVAGTPVHTDEGLKAIEDIEVGDLVASKDDTTGHITWKPVVRLFQNEDKVVLNIGYLDADGDADSLGVTPEHPFWVEGKGWVNAGDLVVGDYIQSLSGESVVVATIEQDAQRHTTYNFEVADYHTYFVGDDGVWVHNQCKNDVPDEFTKPGGGSNADDFITEHSQKHMYDPTTPSKPNRSQFGEDIDVGALVDDTMSNPTSAYSDIESQITKYTKSYDFNISTSDTPTGEMRVFINRKKPHRSTQFPYVPKN